MARLGRSLGLVCAVGVALGASPGRIGAASQPEPGQAVETPVAPQATDPGPDLPPVGRSLFDYVVTEAVATPDGETRRVYRVPYPLSSLMAAIEAKAGVEPGSLRATLFPLGRSLQRDGGAPDFFRFPRAVLAVDAEAESAPMNEAAIYLKDRLYIGFQEQMNLIEVISYNEEAGRFEFQLVEGYGEGLTPEVFYTDRRVCSLCHQSQSPIFSLGPWDETPANRPIRELLMRKRERFFGIDPDHGVDVPDAIDAATDRAGMFSVSQAMWSRGCDEGGEDAAARADEEVGPSSGECRAAALLAMLQFRLSGDRYNAWDGSEHRLTFGRGLEARFSRAWPQGFAVPNVDIPNRDPIAGERPTTGEPLRRFEFGETQDRDIREVRRLAAVDQLFEPSVRRAPREVWTSIEADSPRVGRIVADMSRFFALADIQRLDRHLFARGAHRDTPTRERVSRCWLWPGLGEQTRRSYKLECRNDGEESAALRVDGSIRLAPNGSFEHGVIRRIEFGALGTLTGLRLEAVAPDAIRLRAFAGEGGLRARFPGGHALRELELAVEEEGASGGALRARLRVRVQEDFRELERAVARLARSRDDALSAKPLRRARIMQALFRELGVQRPDGCCVDVAGMPEMRFAVP